jgi:hypothetical protein
MKLLDYLGKVKLKISPKTTSNASFLGLLSDYATADLEALNELNILKTASKSIDLLEELKNNLNSSTIDSIIKKMQQNGLDDEGIILAISLYLAFLKKKYDLSKHFVKATPKLSKNQNNPPNTNNKGFKNVVKPKIKTVLKNNSGSKTVLPIKSNPTKSRLVSGITNSMFVQIFNVANIIIMLALIYLSTLNIVSLQIITSLFYLQVTLTGLFLFYQFSSKINFNFTLVINTVVILTQLGVLASYLNVGFLATAIDVFIISIFVISLHYYYKSSDKIISDYHFLISLGFIFMFFVYLVLIGFYTSFANFIIAALVTVQLTLLISHHTNINEDIPMVVSGYTGILILIASMYFGFNINLVYSIVFIILINIVTSYLYNIIKLNQLDLRKSLTFIIFLSIFSSAIVINLAGITIQTGDLISFGAIYGSALLALNIIRNIRKERPTITNRITTSAHLLGSHTTMILSISSLSALLLQLLTWAGIALAVIIGLSIIIGIIGLFFNR